jgi:phosphonate transport system substrate-binding protein
MLNQRASHIEEGHLGIGRCGLLNGLHQLVIGALFATAAAFLVLSCQSRSNQSDHMNDEDHYLPQFSVQGAVSKQIYIFGVHPLHNPTRLHEMFGPIIRHLSTQIPGVVFRLEASRNYEAFDEKLYAGHFHFALPNPYQTIKAMDHGYTVFAKMDNDEDFHGIIFARRESSIKKPSDLKGKTMCFPAPTALAATMLPQYFLQNNGIDIKTDIDARYVGSQESSIMNVLVGDADAGASWPPPWRALVKERPEISRELKILWETPSLPSNSVMARRDVPDNVKDMVAHVLCDLNETEDGRAWLSKIELSGFKRADNAAYEPVRQFSQHFKTFADFLGP